LVKLTACFVKSPVQTMIFDLPIVTVAVVFVVDVAGPCDVGFGD
jgi:hypothetical protein